MAGVNKVILLGHVGKDPEINRLKDGVTVANFPIATSETFRDKSNGEKKEATEWHSIVMWRGVAESVEKSELKKGDRVYIEGKLRNRKWTDKEGKQNNKMEIVADTFTIITRKRNAITPTDASAVTETTTEEESSAEE